MTFFEELNSIRPHSPPARKPHARNWRVGNRGLALREERLWKENSRDVSREAATAHDDAKDQDILCFNGIILRNAINPALNICNDILL